MNHEDTKAQVVYEGVRLDTGLRLDMVVENCVIVENKSVKEMHPLYQAQILSHLKLSGHRLGLLIKFNVPLIKDGIRRFVM